jgi:hypothetical protein
MKPLYASITALVMSAVVVACQSTAPSRPAVAPQRKMIQFGWDSPDSSYYSKNLSTFEQGIFDGIGIRMPYTVGNSPLTRVDLGDAEFTKAQNELAATKSTKLTDNFMMLWTTLRGEFDWFSDSDWAMADKNIRRYVKTAKLGGLKGIWFDSEDYPGFTFPDGLKGQYQWGYSAQPLKDSKTFAEYQTKLRQRGKQFIEIVQQEFPGTTVLVTIALGWQWNWINAKTEAERQALMQNDVRWGLFPAFFNGMLDGLDAQTKLIDGNELSYYYRNDHAYDYGRNQVLNEALTLIDPSNQDKYKTRVAVGQSVYVDNNMAFYPPEGLYGNYISSDAKRLKYLQHNVYHSLRTSDEYVWVWNQYMDWWGSKGEGVKIPAGVKEAFVDARAKFDAGQPIGITERDFRPAPAAVGAGTNLMQNANFETGEYGPSWNWIYNNGSRVVTDARSGGYAAKVGGLKNNKISQYTNNLKPKTVYTLRAWVKGGAGALWGQAQGTTQEKQKFEASNSFQEVAMTFITDASYKSVYSEIISDGTGDIIVDDMELFEGRGD